MSDGKSMSKTPIFDRTYVGKELVKLQKTRKYALRIEENSVTFSWREVPEETCEADLDVEPAIKEEVEALLNDLCFSDKMAFLELQDHLEALALAVSKIRRRHDEAQSKTK